MNHPNEDQLILYHYGEDSGCNEVAKHLDACESCRANYQALERVMAAVETLPVPEREESYGAEVWRQVRPQLARPARTGGSNFWRLFPWPRWAIAPALGLLVLGAFLAGRFWPQLTIEPAPGIAQSQPLSAGARERILLTEIGDHLERSQLALIELINSKTNGPVDITV
jgi:anti-sigma factor RsiW